MTDHQILILALRNHADLCRRQAARRTMAGAALATARAAKRAEAQQAETLASSLNRPGPDAHVIWLP